MKNSSNVPVEFTVTLDSGNRVRRDENEFQRFAHYADEQRFRPTIGKRAQDSR